MWPDLARYEVVLSDIDGTLSLDRGPLPGAAALIERCRRHGSRVMFITNAAFAERDWILQGLHECGIPAADSELVTATDSLAVMLAVAGVRRAVVIGHPPLARAVALAGAAVVDLGETVDAVVLSMAPAPSKSDLELLADAIRAGAAVYVTSLERGIPTGSGVLPGTGQIVRALSELAAFEPVVCGKPSRAFADHVRSRLGDHGEVLVVGDSLSADIRLAIDAKWDSVLVLSGLTTAEELAASNFLPTYVARGADDVVRHTTSF